MIWFVLALSLLLIAAIILWPFIKPERVKEAREAEDWNRASLKTILAAIDKDEARGVLSPSAAIIQRESIAKKAQSISMVTGEHNDLTPHRRGFILAAGALILAPCFLFGAYMMLGTIDPISAQNTALATQQAPQPQTVVDAIAAVESQIERDPENANLWAALGDLKIRNQDLSGAEIAFETAVSLPVINDTEKSRLWLILAMTRRSQGLPLSDAAVVEPLENSLALDAQSPAAILLQRVKSETDSLSDTPSPNP